MARQRTTHSVTLPAELVERIKIVAINRSNGFQPPFSRIVELALQGWLERVCQDGGEKP